MATRPAELELELRCDAGHLARAAKSLGWLVAVVLLIPSGALAETHLYPQGNPILANGLDMDDDGRLGQPGKDDLVCDSVGGSFRGNAYHEDVDGDGVLEEQIFVDSSRGEDAPSCGAPGSPCKTIRYAEERVDDGIDDEAEPIICARGVFAERMTMPLSGLKTTKTKVQDASRNELAAFFYPKDPAMLLGWDTDDDGIYPPLDPDDEFVLDEQTGFQFAPDPELGGDYWEVAHFRARRSGHQSKANGGFYAQKRHKTANVSFTYFHDGWLEETNFQKCHSTGNMLWNFFTLRVEFQAAERIRATNVYGYVNRGGARGRGLRFDQWSVTSRSRGGQKRDPAIQDWMGNRCHTKEKPHDVSPGASGGGSIMRVWAAGADPLTQFEWLNSRFEFVGSDAPITGREGGFSGGIMLTCLAEVAFSGNLLVNIGGVPAQATGDGICNPRNSPGMRYTRDIYRNNNTIRITDPLLLEDNFFTAAFSVLKGNRSQHKGHDGVTGKFTFNGNLIDYTRLPESEGNRMSSVVAVQTSDRADYSEAQMEIVGNRIVAGSMRRSWGAFLDFKTDSPQGAPLLLTVKDNVMRHPRGAGKSDLMVRVLTPAAKLRLDPDNGGNRLYSCGVPIEWKAAVECGDNPEITLPAQDGP